MKNRYVIFFLMFFLSSSLTAQCVEESHSSFANQGWLSCQESLSIIPERGVNHWILYDFGYVYQLEDMEMWNHNVWGETGLGIKTMIIDYSTDQQNWTTIGPIEVNKAPGSWKYKTNENINLEGVVCRYMMITVVDTWEEDAPCAGIAELKINVDMILDADDVVVNGFKIYPNPATEYLEVEWENLKASSVISIINATGQNVMSYQYQSGQKTRIPVQNLLPGMYHLTIQNGDELRSESFIKM